MPRHRGRRAIRGQPGPIPLEQELSPVRGPNGRIRPYPTAPPPQRLAPRCGPLTDLHVFRLGLEFMDWAAQLATQAGKPLVFTILRARGSVKLKAYTAGNNAFEWLTFRCEASFILMDAIDCQCNQVYDIQATYGSLFLGGQPLHGRN